MIPNQELKMVVSDLHKITKYDYVILNSSCIPLVCTNEFCDEIKQSALRFVQSEHLKLHEPDRSFHKIIEDRKIIFVLIVVGKEIPDELGEIFSSQIKHLLVAYSKRLDKDRFYQELLLGSLNNAEIYQTAEQLHVDTSIKRVVLFMEVPRGISEIILKTLENLLIEDPSVYYITIDESHIVFLYDLNHYYKAQILGFGNMILDMLNTEAMVKVTLSYGCVVETLEEVKKSYNQAVTAMSISKIFLNDQRFVSYERLGIGRLIYHLSIRESQEFLQEVLGNWSPDSMDEETKEAVYAFLDNNLNIAETARQLYIHRNTLLYRLQKVKEMIGLDIRKFDDAMLFKTALMVNRYLKTL